MTQAPSLKAFFSNYCCRKMMVLLLLLLPLAALSEVDCPYCIKKCCNDKKFKYKDKHGNRYGVFDRNDQESSLVYDPKQYKKPKKAKKGTLYYADDSSGTNNITFVQDKKKAKQWLATWYEEYDWSDGVIETFSGYNFYCYSCKDLKKLGLKK
jgi:hypothetical protein